MHLSSPDLMAAQTGKRQLLRQLAEERERLGLSQTEIAARMKTSQAALARLERGDIDPRYTTLERFAEAVGKTLEWRLG